MDVFSFESNKGTTNPNRKIYIEFNTVSNPQFRLSIQSTNALLEREIYNIFAHMGYDDIYKIFNGHFDVYYPELIKAVAKLDYGEW